MSTASTKQSSRKALADISNFQIIKPAFKRSQSDSIQWMQNYCESLNAVSSNTEKTNPERYAKYGVKPELISSRYFENPDVGNFDFSKNKIFKVGVFENGSTGKRKENSFLDPNSGANIGERSRFFLKRSKEILESFYADTPSTSAPEQLIHVTCTGYASPSAAQALISNRKWSTGVTHAYHMGCYAAMPAIRTAQGFVASHQLAERTSANQVDVVHTEMCSLHLNPSSDSVEQTIVHTLFADGNIKYSLTPAGSAKKGFGLYEMAEKIIPDTQDQMSWIPEFWGFQMTLGKRVPVYLKNNIREFVLELYKKAGWELGDEFSKTVFAVHPGGPKIIDVVEEALELSPSQVAASREILFERGNMSSATLPHVWERLLEKNLPSGTPVVSLAFGPGLTVFGLLFKVI